MQKEISVLVVDGASRIGPFTDGLEARGFRVSQARDGIEALRILGETEPSLIILELALGCYDDWHLLKAIRGCSDLPIIGLVDSDNVTRINEGLKFGIDDYVSRSVGFVELELRIRLVVSHSGIGLDGATFHARDVSATSVGNYPWAGAVRNDIKWRLRRTLRESPQDRSKSTTTTRSSLSKDRSGHSVRKNTSC